MHDLTHEVEVVIINWKRPENVAQIVVALRSQTKKCTITICDCHPTKSYALPVSTLQSAHRVYRWNHNTGPFSRYVPIGAFDHEFTLFIDDDMLPGTRCVEHFLDAASRSQHFGVMGQLGRMLARDGIYRAKDVQRTDRFVEVDIVVRAFFVRTRNLPYIVQLRWQMGYMHEQLPEDDLLLCIAMQLFAGLPCLLTPADEDCETQCNKRELRSAHALSKRPDHLARRNAVLERARSKGWIPLARRSLANNGQNGEGVAGVLYLALGGEYARLATIGVRQLRAHGFTGPVRVVTNVLGNELPELGCDIVPVNHTGRGFESRHYKTRLFDWAFDITLALDADAIPIGPIDTVFEGLGNYPIAMCLDRHRDVADVIAHSRSGRERRYREFTLMRHLGLTSKPFYNSGVMVFRRTPDVRRLFLAWHEEWTRFGQEDQLALVRALASTNVHVKTLHPRWNRLPKAFDSVSEAQRQGVRVLHFLSRQRKLIHQHLTEEGAFHSNLTSTS